MVELDKGDFLYQANEEIFLVCIENREDKIEFAVHGWRTIDKERLDQYLDAEKPVIHTENEVEEVIERVDDPDASDKYDWLTEIFEQYSESEIEDESAHEDFSLEDK